jgi:hypothetical protein
MRYERYKRIDNAIKASDSGGIWERWRYGRRCVCDDKMTTSNGSMLDGKLDWLVRRSGASRREIQRRLQCARTYPQESQLRQILAQFRTWDDLHRANFPPVPATEGERPYNPLETDEIIQQQNNATRRATEDAQYDDGALIPRDAFPDSTPMPEIDRWTDQELELQARGMGRAQRRRVYVDSLIKAGGDDWRNMNLGECERAFHDSDD